MEQQRQSERTDRDQRRLPAQRRERDQRDQQHHQPKSGTARESDDASAETNELVTEAAGRVRRGAAPYCPQPQPGRPVAALRGEVRSAEPAERACGDVDFADRARRRRQLSGLEDASLRTTWMSRRLRTKLSTLGGPSPVIRSYPGFAMSTAFAPRRHVAERRPCRPRCNRYSSGFNAPRGWPPLATGIDSSAR